jgi:hypothetical protein
MFQVKISNNGGDRQLIVQKWFRYEIVMSCQSCHVLVCAGVALTYIGVMTMCAGMCLLARDRYAEMRSSVRSGLDHDGLVA